MLFNIQPNVSSIFEARNVLVLSVTVKIFQNAMLTAYSQYDAEHGKSNRVKLHVSSKFGDADINVAELLHWNLTVAYRKAGAFLVLNKN